MNHQTEYEQIIDEYRRVCNEYEEASRAMVALAARSDCIVEEFRHASERVTRLAQRLAALRSAMTLMYEQGETHREPECAPRPAELPGGESAFAHNEPLDRRGDLV